MRHYLSVNSKGHLEFAGCDLTKLAKRYGTPLYVMNEDLIRENCRAYMSAMSRHSDNFGVAYASKAFMTGWISSVVAEEGLYIDVVSGGELYTALRAGFPSSRIIFHGNNKSPEEISLGLKNQIGCFVCDNYFELDNISSLAKAMGTTANVMLRVSPGVEAHTHEYIETGMLDSKFGFALSNGDAWRAVKKALQMPAINVSGLHSHIGSQILSMEGPIAALQKMVFFMHEIKQELGVTLRHLDLGGGLGVTYTESDVPPTIHEYVGKIMTTLHESCDRLGLHTPRVFLEPGRSIVGEAGVTLYTVGAIKHIPGVRTYVSVDGGMADNPRPALYGSVYEAILCNRAAEEPGLPVCLAGKCCESGDILIKEARLPEVRSGDVVAVLTTGAYNYSMASNYNRLPRPAVVAVTHGSSRVVVRRETYQDMVSKDVFAADRAARLSAAAGGSQWEKRSGLR